MFWPVILHVLLYRIKFENGMSLVTRKPSLGFAIRVDSNRSVQPQKLDRGLKFRIKKQEVLYYLGSEQQRC